MPQPLVVLPALGRIAKLGSFYSAHGEQFLPGISLFQSEVTEDHYDETELTKSDIKYSMTTSIFEKLDLLDLRGEMKLSVLTGMVEVKGSASCLNTELKNVQTSEMTLQYSFHSVNQEIFSIKRMKVDVDVMNRVDATHVVVGIDWGARCNLSCQYENTTGKSDDEVNGMLSGVLNRMACKMKAEGEHKDESNVEFEKITFQAQCDVSKLNNISTSFEEAVEIAKELPLAIKEVNDGKGVPLEYYLLPLDVVAKVCRKDLINQLVFASTEVDATQQYLKLFDDILKLKVHVSTVLKTLLKNTAWFTETHENKVTNLKYHINVFHSAFKNEFKNSLVEVRRGKIPSSRLIQILKKAVEKYDGLEEQFQRVLGPCQRIFDIIQLIESDSISVFGRNSFFHLPHGTTIVLYLNVSKVGDDKKLDDHVNYFKRLIKEHKENKQTIMQFFVVITNFHEVSFLVPKIKKYKDCKEIDRDLVGKENIMLNLCCIQVRHHRIKNKAVDGEKVSLKLRCPQSYENDCCQIDKMIWYHEKCGTQVLYGINSKRMFCECGSFRPDSAKFRCNDPNHGMDFCYFSKTSEADIQELKAKKITNVLVLGETGVGKSTWINSIANYLTHDTLDSALKSNHLNALIPAQFSHTKPDGQFVNIKVGKCEENEVHKVGESATQEPTSYLFDIDEDTQICLIDTPGVGDIRGPEQDGENFEKILEHLTYYKEIHGVCILLKPNNARLNIMLRFCIGELLTHLHKSAASNIIFGFTNCRGTFYRPGETLPVLKKLLGQYKGAEVEINPKNTFCFDNESFRLLACIQNGIEFSQEDINAYSDSWEKAVSETAKLFQYIDCLQPHKTKETLSLNSSRKSILQLSKPIAEIQDTIAANIRLVKDKKSDLEETKKRGENLARRLEIKQVGLKSVDLGYPMTVCSHNACQKTVTVGTITKKHAKKPCHDHCFLKGISTGVINDSRLQKCQCMGILPGRRSGICTICGHSWGYHMHLTYKLKQYTYTTRNKEVEKMMKQNKSKAEIYEVSLRSINRDIEQHTSEKETIFDISAKFACYLAHNSITPYNDAVEAHLEYLIDEKGKLGKSKEKKDLEQMLDRYKVEKETIERAIKNVDQSIHSYINTPKEVDRLINKLFSLPKNGRTIKRLFDHIQKYSDKYRFREISYHPDAYKRKKKRRQYSSTNSTALLVQNNYEIEDVSALTRAYRNVSRMLYRKFTK